jgi:hypothetical protein
MLLDITIGKPKFKYYSENRVFYAENNSRKSLFPLLFFGMMSIFIFSGFIFLIKEKEFNLELFLIGFIIHPIFGIIGLRKFLWLIRGKEIIKIDEEKMTISKSGTFWTKDKIFKKSEIKNIRDKFQDDNYNKTPFEFLNEYRNSIKEYNRGMIYLTIGEVLFDYKYSKVRVFNWLNKNERQILIVEMKKYLENKNSH